MAMASIWNPGDASMQDLDEYGQPKKPGGMVQPGGGGYDLDAFYQRTLGRAPDANERATDLENIGKYGAAGFESDFLGKRPNNTPGSGTYDAGAATAPYSGSASSGSAAPAGVSPFTSGLRDILMEQLGAMGKAPTVNDPGIAENLAGRRLALQRGAEGQRRNAAEMRAYDGSGGLGGKAFETDARGILERQSEAEARGVGDVLGGELQQRRQQLSSLLSMALQSGDAESARTIQRELAQMQNQFNYAGLGQQQGQFEDSMAFNYAGMNQSANLQALMAMLGAV